MAFAANRQNALEGLRLLDLMTRSTSNIVLRIQGVKSYTPSLVSLNVGSDTPYI
jgi:hypothetical protein